MAQLSRPYQIALGAVAVLALVWLVALRGHSSNPNEPPSASAPSKSVASSGSSGAGSSAQERSAAAPSPVYHGSAPGVEGLTRDINKAHGAVATSQQNARRLQRDSARASGETAAGGSGRAFSSHATASGAHGGAAAKGSSHTTTHARAGGSTRAGHGGRGGRAGASPASGSGGRAPQQVQVERELAHGKTVLLLFWEPKSSVDNAVRSQALALGASSKGKVVVHVALTDQVGLFGPVTEVAHVYQTPTILIVGRHGLVTTLSGLVDKFSLQQAVREAEHANR